MVFGGCRKVIKHETIDNEVPRLSLSNEYKYDGCIDESAWQVREHILKIYGIFCDIRERNNVKEDIAKFAANSSSFNSLSNLETTTDGCGKNNNHTFF